jgi:hypothetical protein
VREAVDRALVERVERRDQVADRLAARGRAIERDSDGAGANTVLDAGDRVGERPVREARRAAEVEDRRDLLLRQVEELVGREDDGVAELRALPGRRLEDRLRLREGGSGALVKRATPPWKRLRVLKVTVLPDCEHSLLVVEQSCAMLSATSIALATRETNWKLPVFSVTTTVKLVVEEANSAHCPEFSDSEVLL